MAEGQSNDVDLERYNELPPWSGGRLLKWFVFSIVLSFGIGLILTIVYAQFMTPARAGRQVMEALLYIHPVSMGLFLLRRLELEGYPFSRLFTRPSGASLTWAFALALAFTAVRYTLLPSALLDRRFDLARIQDLSLLLRSLSVAPLFEELFFRMLLFQAYEKTGGANRAALVSSIAFVIYHIDTGVTIGYLVSVLGFGLVACALIFRTRSYLAVWAFHISINAASYLIYLTL